MATQTTPLTPRARLYPEDTIAALASAPGSGPRAIVRISGPHTWHVILSVVGPDPSMPASIRHGQWTAAAILDGLSSAVPIQLLGWRAPRSYTGQDLAEIHLLSSPPLVDALMAKLLASGARAAEPGEFTLRAFLAGKLDLVQAEAVLGVIEAEQPEQLHSALTQLAGGVTRPLDALRSELLGLLAEVEAGLDFAEEDIQFISRTESQRRIAAATQALRSLLAQVQERDTGGWPFRVVLAGKPNAGKSSLFNALLGIDAALVSEQAGTTRDYLTRRVWWDGVELELVDTAGAVEAASEIEAQAQSNRAAQSVQADLIVWCAALIDPESFRRVSPVESPQRPVLAVWTKYDLAKVPSEPHPQSPNLATPTSALTGHGIAELRARLTDQARRRPAGAIAASGVRCRHHLRAAEDHLNQASAVLTKSEPAELLALELRSALDEIGALTGAVYTDDLLDRVFGRFCIGK